MPQSRKKVRVSRRMRTAPILRLAARRQLSYVPHASRRIGSQLVKHLRCDAAEASAPLSLQHNKKSFADAPYPSAVAYGGVGRLGPCNQ